MSEDCIFCSIVAGEVPSRTVYEDDATMAFLDANPLSRGHTVVIPREHHEHVEDMPGDLAGRVFETMHALTGPIQEAVDADGTNLGFNNGAAAGQEVPHVHGHVIPRFDGDGGGPLHAMMGPRPDFSESELDDVAAAIDERT